MSKYTDTDRPGASAAPPCLPGCGIDHTIDGLGFTLCNAPVATLALGYGHRGLAVSVSRVVEPPEPTFISVALGVVEDGEPREPMELDPAVARALAAALLSGADLAEHTHTPEDTVTTTDPFDCPGCDSHDGIDGTCCTDVGQVDTTTAWPLSVHARRRDGGPLVLGIEELAEDRYVLGGLGQRDGGAGFGQELRRGMRDCLSTHRTKPPACRALS
jgi:hypothetical protein